MPVRKASLAPDCVSVVEVSYNAGPHLSECVESALTAAGVVEVIVSDNASGDGSIEALSASYASESRRRIVRNGANLGFAAAWNIGGRTWPWAASPRNSSCPWSHDSTSEPI